MHHLNSHSKDRGCTSPGGTAPAYHSQVHHATADWIDGGQTNITDESLACGGSRPRYPERYLCTDDEGQAEETDDDTDRG